MIGQEKNRQENDGINDLNPFFLSRVPLMVLMVLSLIKVYRYDEITLI